MVDYFSGVIWRVQRRVVIGNTVNATRAANGARRLRLSISVIQDHSLDSRYYRQGDALRGGSHWRFNSTGFSYHLWAVAAAVV